MKRPVRGTEGAELEARGYFEGSTVRTSKPNTPYVSYPSVYEKAISCVQEYKESNQLRNILLYTIII